MISPTFFVLKYLFGCSKSWLQHANSWLLHVGSSSLTRGQAQAPALGAQSLSHWTTREAPVCISRQILNHWATREVPTPA